MTAINKYEERAVPFDAWILRVARNAALDHLRAKRAIPTEEVRLTDTGRAQTGHDRGRALRQALEDLPEDQREVLVLRHIVGLSPVEIADTLDKSESSVHGLHHRGRRSLRANLTELDAAPVVAAPPEPGQVSSSRRLGVGVGRLEVVEDSLGDPAGVDLGREVEGGVLSQLLRP